MWIICVYQTLYIQKVFVECSAHILFCMAACRSAGGRVHSTPPHKRPWYRCKTHVIIRGKNYCLSQFTDRCYVKTAWLGNLSV